jgi:hypothetical protein
MFTLLNAFAAFGTEPNTAPHTLLKTTPEMCRARPIRPIRHIGFALAIAAVFFGLTPQRVWAGRPCEQKPQSVDAVTRGLALAERTLKRLDESGEQVVVLARVGQDLSEYGLRYSHLGFAYKDGGVWRVLHKLNHCGSDKAAVYREGMGEFFMDAPHEYIAGVMPLNKDVQQRLLPVLKEPYLAAGVHARAYNMLAYPWATDYQQSNQWAIETLAVAMGAGDGSRRAAQAWLRHQGYEPTELRLSALKRLGARVTSANISFDDHPTALRFSGRIRTVTVDSVMAWLQRSGLGEAQWAVR